MIVGMPRSVQRLKFEAANADPLTFPHRKVDVRSTAYLGHGASAASAFPKASSTGHMVGVDMGLDCIFEGQLELAQKLEVSLDGLEDGIDQQSFAAVLASDQIGICRRLRLKQLAKQH